MKILESQVKKGKELMDKLDFKEVQKHINILNVAYHLNLEITDKSHAEVKVVCPFCGYNKNSKIATLSLNTINNKYHCIRCGAGRLFYWTLCKSTKYR